MSRKLEKFVVLFDNTNLLYFPGQFLSGRVLVELKDDTQALGKYIIISHNATPPPPTETPLGGRITPCHYYTCNTGYCTYVFHCQAVRRYIPITYVRTLLAVFCALDGRIFSPPPPRLLLLLYCRRRRRITSGCKL